MNAAILIIEDEALLARNIARFLERAGHDVDVAGRMDEGLALHAANQPDVILVDQNLPDGAGIDIVRAIRRTDRAAKIVMITAYGNVQLAVGAMKAGADDYLTKPVPLDEIDLLVKRLLAQRQTEGSLAYYRRRDERRSGLDQIIGTSPAITDLKSRIRQIVTMQARQLQGTPPPVLITGETGTGKELVARALHFDGPRRDAPFVELNCAALPGHLIESELFGHEKGAFTDAKERRAGLIQSADGGTLFLDEVGEMPLAAQAKLLKVLEDGRVRPLGSTRDRLIDVRFIAATNAAIEDRAASGAFRADLYYRLRGLTIETPPLHSRDGDVLLLAEHFLTEHRRRYGRTDLALGPEAAALLARHRWPGNVRELRNIMEQAALLTVGPLIGPADLNLREPPALGAPPENSPRADANVRLDTVERDLIVHALTQAAGNVTVAADALGISRDTLRYRMERHTLRRGAFLPNGR